jgi:predicted enzyme related to lactoylglutathione lyase
MPRPVHFEIQADNPERAMKFYRELFGWEFNQWESQPYWLIKTGEKGTPGIDGGLMPRKGPVPTAMQSVNAFVCTTDVASCDETAKRVTGSVVRSRWRRCRSRPSAGLPTARTRKGMCSGSCSSTRMPNESHQVMAR